MPFVADTGHFKHPSAPKPKKKGATTDCKQGARAREKNVWIKVSQWTFPDTSYFFGQDITTCAADKFNSATEQWSEAALTLLYPHRHAGDLKLGTSQYPFTRKLQAVFAEDKMRKQVGEEPIMFTVENMQFLQNIQDTARNSGRYKVDKDDLQSGTEPFHPKESNSDAFEEDEDEEEKEENAHYEMFLNYLEPMDRNVPDPTDNDPRYLDDKLNNFSFKDIRNKGKHQCGYLKDHEIQPVLEKPSDKPFLLHRLPDTSRTRKDKQTFPKEKIKFKQGEIVRLLFKKTTTKPRTDILDDVQLDLSEANGSIESIREWGAAAFSRDRKQRRAFECIVAAFLLTFYDVDKEDDLNDVDPQRTASQFRKSKLALLRLKGNRGTNKNAQLIALLHGPGGSGKSTVINMVKAYAQSYCEAIGHVFTNRTIIVTAMSGVAATLLHGETTHSVVGLNRTRLPQEMIDQFADARLLIIDEISFACDKDMAKLHQNCIQLMQNHYASYGGLNIVFAGDYSQLKPVGQGKLPIYDDYCPYFHGKLNCFIELDGKWRFKDDEEWGDVMLHFREGLPTVDDVRMINSTCHVSVKTPPPGIQVATHKNVNRDAINAAIFEQYCRTNRPANGAVLDSAAIIFMDNLEMKNSSNTPVPVQSNAVKKHFYENCAENDLDVGDKRGRADPMLKLYFDCPLMLVENADVPNGQANGSRVRLRSITMKAGEEAFHLKLQCGTTVRAMYASQVLALQVEHESPDITPRNFEVKSAKVSFKATIQIGTEECITGMTGNQFPLISNSCTTGHKLQGCTCASILVNEWYYGANWPYVVLSRVKTRKGLHIRQLLDENLAKY